MGTKGVTSQVADVFPGVFLLESEDGETDWGFLDYSRDREEVNHGVYQHARNDNPGKLVAGPVGWLVAQQGQEGQGILDEFVLDRDVEIVVEQRSGSCRSAILDAFFSLTGRQDVT